MIVTKTVSDTADADSKRKKNEKKASKIGKVVNRKYRNAIESATKERLKKLTKRRSEGRVQRRRNKSPQRRVSEQRGEE